jgi:alcohol dehydrogenase class IV
MPHSDHNTGIPKTIRPAVLAGAFSGVACGVVVGAMTGPFGIVMGVAMGLVVGMIVGHVIETEDHRRDHRTRELDEIIGVTTGDMSARSASLVSSEARESHAELERWANEWLTPPPPASTV